ncbi:MAG: AAA family ATPase [Planctomycetales bacterium]|nr:AAA family ATPase [Planctomycetales bacterium]
MIDSRPQIIDPKHVREFLVKTLAEGQTFEIRVLKASQKGSRYTQNWFGYFDDPAAAISELSKFEYWPAAYFTPQRIKPELFARAANRIAPAKDVPSTADGDVTDYRWLLIDLDPNRPAGISSTQTELDLAEITRDEVVEKLTRLGWSAPVVNCSGNGWHVMYRIDLPAADKDLVKRILETLDQQFSTDAVKVDTTVFNPARIWKLPGTLSCKGDSTPERPHRMAYNVTMPDDLVIVTREQLESYAAEFEEPTPKPSATSTAKRDYTGQPFSLVEWMARHLPDAKAQPYQGGHRWILKPSPMCEHHEGAAFVVQPKDGPIGAGCRHNSCSWNWHDLREHFEPKGSRPKNNPQRPAQEPTLGTTIRKTTLRDAAEKYLTELEKGQTNLIRTGIPLLDEAIGGGFADGEMVIVAARPSHGKSAIGLQMAHQMSADGLPIVVISEEMSELALGKRAIQYASSVPEEHWRSGINGVRSELGKHFATRKPILVFESCGSVDRACDEIERAVNEDDIRVAMVDYAQLLDGKGRDAREKVSHVSSQLRRLASRLGIVVIVLAQLNRTIEKRGKFVPMMSDIKETGQLEQDADVILFGVWPHRINSEAPPNEYQFFVCKNRNRAIHVPAFTCEFNPARQMMMEPKPANYESSFDDWNEWD